MPYTAEIKALAEKVEKATNTLDRYWVLQAAVGSLGVLYLVDTSLAGALAENFRLKSELVRIVVPIVTFCLFTNMGYVLGEYLIAYPVLFKYIQRQFDREILGIATRNYSVYRFIATLIVRQGRGSGVSGWEIVPGTIGVLLATSVFNLSNSMAIYFIHTFTESLPFVVEVSSKSV